MERAERFARRLQAIAVIDVAGYSRLMSSEESLTHARVGELFENVVKPLLRLHGGREIERAGDGLLVLFESSTSAVVAALGVQRAVAAHQQAVDAGRRMLLRIGINVGDIIIDGAEIAGDDVNVAARLQALAAPGHVCIAAAVREQIHEDLECTYSDRGVVALKNITRPIRVYELRPPEAGAAAGTGAGGARFLGFALPARRGRWVLAALLVMGLAAVALAVLGPWRGAAQVAYQEAPPMSIAVLPFNAADAGVQALSGELTSRVTRRLAATSWIAVAAPEEAARYVDRATANEPVRRSPHVRYTLRSRVRADGNTVAVEAEMTDTAKGVSVWVGQARAARGPGAPEDELAGNLVVQLREAIYAAEARRLRESGGVPRTPMEHKMLGDEQREKFVTLQGERKAREHYERALAMDPNFVPAIIAAAYMLLAELDLDPAVVPQPLLDLAEQLSKRAVSREPGSAPAWQLRSEVLARQWLWDAARDASDQAIALDPGRAFAFGQRASLLARMGKPREALEYADRALALAEQRSGYALFQRCHGLMALGQYAASAEACERSIAREDWWLQHAYLLAAYALLGHADKAAAERRRLLDQQPDFTLQRVHVLRLSNVPEFQAQLNDSLLRGLRLAGIPEGR